jgi:hypothetical protein
MEPPVGAEGEGGNIRHLFIVVLSQRRLVQNLATIEHNVNGMIIFVSVADPSGCLSRI